jgi:outer membrane lipoprotein-sorting protein
MKSLRLLFLIVAGCCFLPSEPASAQGAAPAYAFPKQYSADEVMTTKDGTSRTIKTYMDNGKVRTEISANGTQIVAIVRPDQQKMYSVMAAQKMIMVVPLDAEKLKQMAPPGAGGDAKVETVGPDPVDGVAATKYKVTNDNGKVVYFWVDAAKQVPIKLISDDGTFTITWTNFQTGPQDASLFEPPTGYQVINMPAAPGASGAPPAGGGQ